MTQYNFKALHFYANLSEELKDKFFTDMDFGNGPESEIETHLRVTSFFYDSVMSMDNETYCDGNDSGDAGSIKAAALFMIDPFHRVIMKNNLYEKYPEDLLWE